MLIIRNEWPVISLTVKTGLEMVSALCAGAEELFWHLTFLNEG